MYIKRASFSSKEERDSTIASLIINGASVLTAPGANTIHVTECPSGLGITDILFSHGLLITRVSGCDCDLQLRGDSEHVKHFHESVLPQKKELLPNADAST